MAYSVSLDEHGVLLVGLNWGLARMNRGVARGNAMDISGVTSVVLKRAAVASTDSAAQNV